jgi:hypothetical protein
MDALPPPPRGSPENAELEDAELDARIEKLEAELATLRAMRMRRRTEHQTRKFGGGDFTRLLKELEKMGFSRQQAAPILEDCAKKMTSDEEILQDAVDRLCSAGGATASTDHPILDAPPSAPNLLSIGAREGAPPWRIEDDDFSRNDSSGRNAEKGHAQSSSSSSASGREAKQAGGAEEIKPTKHVAGRGSFSTPLKRHLVPDELMDCDSTPPRILSKFEEVAPPVEESSLRQKGQPKASPRKEQLAGGDLAAVEENGDIAEMEGDSKASLPPPRNKVPFPKKQKLADFDAPAASQCIARSVKLADNDAIESRGHKPPEANEESASSSRYKTVDVAPADQAPKESIVRDF